MKTEVSVSSPGTVANLVCGFDILGLALDQPCDKLIIRKTNKAGVRIINKDDYGLPDDPERNVIGAALLALLKSQKASYGFEVESTKSIKPGSGIGSSAASAAGAVVGANILLGNRFSKEELIDFAMYGEEVASGSRHADNIAPCIYGGITLVRSKDPLDIVCIPIPELYVTVLHPQIEIRTSDAREILKKQILLKEAVGQWANVGGLVAGLITGNYELISRSLNDRIVEPVRSILIPAFQEVKEAGLKAGALGGGISGSGPSVFMLSRSREIALHVECAMRSVYDQIDIDYNTHVCAVNTQGVKVMD